MVSRDSLFAAKNDGKVPKLGHVESLMDLPLICSPVSVIVDGDCTFIVVLLRERNAGPNRSRSSYDTVPTKVVPSKHVHGSSLALRNASTPTEQFADDGFDAASSHQCVSMASVSRDKLVI